MDNIEGRIIILFPILRVSLYTSNFESPHIEVESALGQELLIMKVFYQIKKCILLS